LGAAAAALVPSFLTNAGAANAFNWRQFAGQSIFIQFMKKPWGETMQKMLPDFEKQTGIKVEFAELPEIQARLKASVEFTARSGGIDVWTSTMHVEKRRFWKAGWYTDLRKFLNDPTMTAPDYDWNDVVDRARQVVTQPDGTISVLPTEMDAYILFYRKDLFAQKGLKPPKTLSEMEEVARTLHNPPSMYGFVARGLKNANVPGWDWVLFSMGGDVLTKDGKASLNTPEAVKATDWYAGMLRRFAPPGVVNFHWYECSAAFMQGQVAMYVDGCNFANQFEDKAKSKVAGSVGYAVLPAGPGDHCTIGGVDGLAVSPQSKRQGPAYLFAQWATTKESVLKEQLAGVGGSRMSVWNAPEMMTQAKMPADWVRTYAESLKIWRHALPEIVGATQYRDIVGVAVQKAIEGGKPSDLMAQAHKEFQEMLNQTEK
jgi:multiple sugar transport system substrate-binding protein